MSRVARATIHLDALRHNMGIARRAAPDCHTMAVLKANAYGHGLMPVAHALDDLTDALAVSCLDEALPLREAGIERRIVLLEGFFDADEIAVFAARRLDAVIHQPWQIEALAASAPTPAIDCWLKVDTGMGRLGFLPEEAGAAADRLRALPAVGQLRWMTHLARADEPDDPATDTQIQALEQTAAETVTIDERASIANSAGTLHWPASQRGWLRPGIMLYGASPFADAAIHEPLRPAMTLEARLISVKTLPAGHGVGYGARFVCPEAMPVGVVSMGYGDGYPRHAPDGTPVVVNGRRTALIGKVSMDMLAVDLRPVPDARVGDPVVLWGADPLATEVAGYCGTISYELFCRLTPRVQRVYRQGDG
ncbi:UNVERIFIED_CONTAM: alanine racemase [Spiribacter pallidus]